MDPSTTLAERPQLEAAVDGAPRMRTGRVILAEDDLEMRDLLVCALTRDGYEVVAAANGMELLDRIEDSRQTAQPVDVVVTDIRMPGITGMEALTWLRESGCLEPVILITAFGDRRTHLDAERLGAWAVLDKPFEIEELLALVHGVPRKRERG